jgi:N-acetylmuramoyl-L-alanine amidase
MFSVNFKKIVLTVMVCCMTFSAYATNYVKAVRMNNTSGEWQYVFDLTQPANYSTFSLKNPARYVVDLKNTAWKSKPLTRSLWKNTPVSDIRVAKKSKGTLRFVFDLKRRIQPGFQKMNPRGRRGYRLVVNFNKRGQTAAKFSGRAAFSGIKSYIDSHLPPDKQKTTHNKTVRIIQKKQTAPPSRAKAPVAAAANIKSSNRKIIVVIDPGHGGKDPGATGPSGTHEKTVVLEIARDLQRFINKQPGFTAVLTRKGDYYISLRKRLSIARNYHGDMFIAIHADAFINHKAYGASVFALSSRGATSEAARWLAKRENASELLGGVELNDKSRLLKSVLIDLSQTATIGTSIKIGRDIIQSLKGVTPLHHGRVEQAAFVVLKSPDIPSLLVETGFISNPKEERNLNNPRYQDRLAMALMHGIKRYFVSHPPRGTWLASHRADKQRYVVSRGDTLSAIAVRYSVSINQLKTVNRLATTNIHIGQVLYIPVGGVG